MVDSKLQNTQEPIIEVDKLFTDKFSKIERELRIATSGRNGNDFDILKIIPNNNGSTCHHKFSFNYPGNRCVSCNELCFLTEDGDINLPFTIKTGRWKGKQIACHRFPFNESDTGIFKSQNGIIVSPNKTLHYVALAPFLNWSNINNFKTRFVSAYRCNGINVIQLIPNLGVGINHTLDKQFTNTDGTIDPKIAEQVILVVINGLINGGVSYGNTSIEQFSFEYDPNKKYKIKSKTVELPVQIYLDPSKDTYVNAFYMLDADKIKNTNLIVAEIPIKGYERQFNLHLYDDDDANVQNLIQVPSELPDFYVKRRRLSIGYDQLDSLLASKQYSTTNYDIATFLLSFLSDKRFSSVINSENINSILQNTFVNYVQPTELLDTLEKVKRFAIEKNILVDHEARYRLRELIPKLV